MTIRPPTAPGVSVLWAGVLLAALLWALTGAAAAQGGAISQGYLTKSSGIGEGVLVSLTASGSDEVVPATAANDSNLAGVAADKPVLELSASGKSDVQVVVGGSTRVLVSDANGAVKAGDKIAVSPLAGIGMKATGDSEVVGTAQEALSAVKTVTEQAAGKDGRRIAVRVGLVPVEVTVAYYSTAPAAGSVSAFVPPFFQSLADAVTGKTVSPLRVLIGAAALLLGFAAAAIMLYVGVRSGVISLGRNPLAADALRRGMVDVLIAAFGVLVVTGVIVAAVLLA